MAAKRTSSRSSGDSKKRSEAKQALANMEKAHKSLQLNLKKLKSALGHGFGQGHSFGAAKGHSFGQGHGFGR